MKLDLSKPVRLMHNRSAGPVTVICHGDIYAVIKQDGHETTIPLRCLENVPDEPREAAVHAVLKKYGVTWSNGNVSWWTDDGRERFVREIVAAIAGLPQPAREADTVEREVWAVLHNRSGVDHFWVGLSSDGEHQKRARRWWMEHGGTLMRGTVPLGRVE